MGKTYTKFTYADIFNSVIFLELVADQIEALSQPYIASEVVMALKGMHPTKLLDVIDIMLFFIKDTGILWGIISLAWLLNFFSEGGNIEDVNSTFIMFIPKVKNVVQMWIFILLAYVICLQDYC